MPISKQRRYAGPLLLALAGIGCSGPRGDSLLVGRETSGNGGAPLPSNGGTASGGFGGASGAALGGAGGFTGGAGPGTGGESAGGTGGESTAGTGGVPVQDASGPSTALCLKNPSFEGGSTFGGMPPDWIVCQGSPLVAPAYNAFPPSDGASHLALMSIATDGVSAVTRTSPCAPLRAGEAMSFAVDLTLSRAFSPFGAAYVQIWGTVDGCTKDELLWTSPLLEEFEVWKTYCGTLTPSRAFPYLVIAPSPDGSAPTGTPTVAPGAYVLLDHFRDAACN